MKKWMHTWKVMKLLGITEPELMNIVSRGLLAGFDQSYVRVKHYGKYLVGQTEDARKTGAVLSTEVAYFDANDVIHFQRHIGVGKHSCSPCTDLVRLAPQSNAAPAPPEAINGETILRRANVMAVARALKRDLPDLTIKEAAQEINARLAATEAFDKDGNPLMQGYSVKHLMKLIKTLGFKPGKPGPKPKK